MDLRTRRKRKLLSLEKVGGTETEDSPPGPPPGEGAALFSPSPEKEQIPTSSGCPRQRCFRRLPGRLGAWLGRGGLCSPARGSTRRPRYRFGRESGCQLTGLGRETRTVPPSGGVSWAQVHRDRSLHLGNARVPSGHSAVEGSEDGGGGRGASGRERGHPRLRQLLMHLREERHWSGCEPRPAPRNQSSSREGSGLGGLLTSSPMLTAARASMAVSSGSGAAVATTPEGGSPTAIFILRGREPIPRCCNQHPLLEPERSALVAAEGANPFIKERRDRSEIMLIRPQQTHESSTNTSSACWKPRH